jgi:hypothetical protein
MASPAFNFSGTGLGPQLGPQSLLPFGQSGGGTFEASGTPSFPTGGAPMSPLGTPGPTGAGGSLPFGSTPPGGGSYTGQQTATSFAAFPGQGDTRSIPTFDPTFTNQMLSLLSGQMGQGLPRFNQSTFLPTGGQTAYGQLTAPLNPVLQQLQDFMSGKTGPEGLPGVLPMWQSEMSAMQQPIEANLANLREEFGARGALGSSELAGADMDYLSQTSADEMALLTQATQASLPQMLQTGQGLQQIDQSAITNAYQQFMQTLPQYNPLLPDMMSLAESSPGAYNKQGGIGTAVLGALPGMASGAASGISAGLGAAGAGGGGLLSAILTGLAAI